MKQVGRWVILFIAFVSCASRSAPNIDPEALQRQLFLSLLLDADVQGSVLGARSIRVFYPNDIGLHDAIAEKLVQNTKVDPPKKLVDMVEWYIELLGELKNPRYRDVLMHLREHTSNEALLKRVDTALGSIGVDEVPQYIAGSIDLTTQQAEAAHALSSMRQTNHDEFAQIKSESTLPEVLTLLGAPDDATVWKARAQKLLLHYAGQGLFVLTVDRETSPQYVVAAIYPELLPVASLYSGNDFGTAQTLCSFDGRYLMAFIKSQGRKIRRDTNALAMLAKRIELLPLPDSRYDRSVLENGLKLLARSNDPNALDILKRAVTATRPGKGKGMLMEALETAENHQAKLARKASKQDAEQDDQEEDGSAEDAEAKSET